MTRECNAGIFSDSSADDEELTCHTGSSTGTTIKASNVTKATKAKAPNNPRSSTMNTANNVAERARPWSNEHIASDTKTIHLLTTCLAQWTILVGVCTLESLGVFMWELLNLPAAEHTERERGRIIDRLKLRWMNTAQLAFDDSIKYLFDLGGSWRKKLRWYQLAMGTDQQRLNALVEKFRNTLNAIRKSTQIGNHVGAFLRYEVEMRQNSESQAPAARNSRSDTADGSRVHVAAGVAALANGDGGGILYVDMVQNLLFRMSLRKNTSISRPLPSHMNGTRPIRRTRSRG